MPRVTAFYAALLALLMLVLAFRVVISRRKALVGVGDGGQPELARCIRVHGNAVEYVRIALLLLLLLELLAVAPIWLHGFGIALLAGRVLHAIGLSGTGGKSFGRFVGTLTTWLVITAMALVLLWQSVVWWLI